jgi:ABC-2 type transport system ATP-binding protein
MWKFLDNLNAAGTTIILTTHYLEEAERLCRNIAIINKGEIIEHSSMKTLLAKLHAEIFILDLSKPINTVPPGSEFDFHLKDDTTIEVTVYMDQTINDVFAFLSERSIQVTSMRGKSNRLEELFVNLIQENE